MMSLNSNYRPANGAPRALIRFPKFAEVNCGVDGGAKCALVLLVVLVVSGVSALGQAAIGFQNIGSGAGLTTVNAPVRNADGTLLAGTNFSVQLYTAPTAAGPFSAQGTPKAFGTNVLFAGYFFGGSVIISGYAVGAQPVLIVRAWDNVSGTVTSYSNALVRGQSAPFQSPPLGDNFTPSSIPVPQGLTSFSLRNDALPPTRVASSFASATLTFGTDAGQAYRVEWSDDLQAWNTLSNFTASNVLFQLVDEAITVTNRRFYRAVELR